MMCNVFIYSLIYLHTITLKLTQTVNYQSNDVIFEHYAAQSKPENFSKDGAGVRFATDINDML